MKKYRNRWSSCEFVVKYDDYNMSCVTSNVTSSMSCNNRIITTECVITTDNAHYIIYILQSDGCSSDQTTILNY